ncbi:hypothetical protein CWB96_00075 [Pseudoalteromonas citrea]|uniref:Replication protein n=1 Tax=Pseudoalteromonas citrea TaxID=43655 RepID=A0A5S3XV56_9GAMM|nr:hypothetical protein [Pseudoalteromonas citrea]TMP46262.1 hypothetical protein CWB97_02070 [Pseudoalteromonas citrea]TMP63038.1 hypothetical protein CWB96_00075 [Pseudoalteromonas citrea]
MTSGKVLVTSVLSSKRNKTGYYLDSSEQFDKDWNIGLEPALRWFARSKLFDGKITDFKACGTPNYPSRRVNRLTKKEYLSWAYTQVNKEHTAGCYMTPNLFFDWRNSQNLKGFCAHWLEIDTRSHQALCPEEAWEIYQEISDTLGESKLPPPTSWTLTGSGGVHLYWRYEQAEVVENKQHRANLISRWKEISNKLSDKLESTKRTLGYQGWHVDRSASNDPTRLMRMPGSRHHKTGREVLYISGGPLTNFNQLGDKLGFKKHIHSEVVKPIHVPKSIHSGKYNHHTKTDTVTPRLIKLTQQWEALLSRSGQVSKGKRDLTAFHLYNLYRRIMAPEHAWKKIVTINESFIGFTLSQLTSYLSSSIKTTYRYTLQNINTVLQEQLDLPIQLPIFKKIPLSNSERIEKQAKAGRKTAKKRVGDTHKKLLRILNIHCKNTEQLKKITPQKLQALSGLSRATIYRHFNNILKIAVSRRPICLSTLYKKTPKVSHSLVPLITPPKPSIGKLFSKGVLSISKGTTRERWFQKISVDIVIKSLE